MIDRRSVLSGLVGLTVAPGLAAAGDEPEAGRQDFPPLRGAFPLKWGQATEVGARSNPIKGGKHDIHIITIQSAKFDLDSDSRLTVTLRAMIVQHAQVDYWISAAVFDAEGRLLGAASHKEAVRRVMLGRVGMTTRDIALDFGLSNGYGRAAFATVAVGERDVPASPNPPASPSPKG